ncbi:MAG: hypothetical protein J2P36_35840, partial [Ktedonobacteraceae bacterium]|nr:hypothetical protein [Ktedonobacteraceae bacterium]
MRQRGVRQETAANISLMLPDRPPHWQIEAIFSPAAACALRDHGASDDLLSPLSGLSHRFLARIDTIVLFFLEDNKQGITFHDRTSAFSPPLLRGLGDP